MVHDALNISNTWFENVINVNYLTIRSIIKVLGILGALYNTYINVHNLNAITYQEKFV